jgi:hypothetical protein
MTFLIIWLIVWLVMGTPAVSFTPPNAWAITLIIVIILMLWPGRRGLN